MDATVKGSQYIMNTYNRYPICFVKGKGCYLEDDKGKQYLDLVAGIAVNNLGYAHPKVIQAINEQAEELVHISNLYWSKPQIELAKRLCEASNLDKVFFCNSGAEANESAIKLARKWGGNRKHIISLKKSFHGRTMGALTATGQEKYQKSFMPLIEGFSYVDANDLDMLKETITDHTCAVMVEIIQGEGGVRLLDKDYLLGVQTLCKENHLLLMVDEVQTGFARTGTPFAFQQAGLEPDVISLAKAIANGIPMGAILAKDMVAEAFVAGDHASTFGGNPLAAHVGTIVCDELFTESFLKSVSDKGYYFKEGLKKLLTKYPEKLKEVRGIGLMLGLECFDDVASYVEKAQNKGLLIGTAGKNVLRFVPPLIISETEIDQALAILEQVIEP